jgi:hypothetical protein
MVSLIERRSAAPKIEGRRVPSEQQQRSALLLHRSSKGNGKD